MPLYTSKTTKLELTQIIDRLSADNAQLRTALSEAQGDLDRLRNAPPEIPASTGWTRGPRPPASGASRDPGFTRRAETMRTVGAHLATTLGRPATRGEVLAEIERLASTN